MLNNKIALIGHKSARLTFVFEAAERLGYEVYQIVCKGEPWVSDFACCKQVIELDLFNQPESSLEEFICFYESYELNGVFSMREQLLPWVQKASEKLGLSHNGSECVRACRDKLIMRQKLTQAGLPQPYFIDGNRPENLNDVQYPVVVKPSAGAGSIGVIKADNPKELQEAFSLTRQSIDASLDQESLYVEKGGVIVEGFVQGEELVCDTFSVDGKLLFISIGNKGDCAGPYFEKSIYQVPAKLETGLESRIIETVQRALTALGLNNGPSHTELRVYDGIPFIIEVGARIGGSGVPAELIRLSSGVELFDACFQLATGETIYAELFQEKKRKFAGNYVIPLGTGGTFSSYHGLDWVNSVDATQRVVTNYIIGDYIPGYPLCTSYPGFIISEHKTFQEMENFHQQVESNLNIEWEQDEHSSLSA